MWQRLCNLSAFAIRMVFIMGGIVVVLGLTIGMLAPVYFIVRGPEWSEEWRPLLFGIVLLALIAGAAWHQLDATNEYRRWRRRRARQQ